jgi:hypothetical protein
MEVWTVLLMEKNRQKTGVAWSVLKSAQKTHTKFAGGQVEVGVYVAESISLKMCA